MKPRQLSFFGGDASDASSTDPPACTPEPSPAPAAARPAPPPPAVAEPVPAAPVALAPRPTAPPAPQPAEAAPRSPTERADPPAVLTVAGLDRLVKRVVEGSTANVRVQGEVSGLRRAGSGHAYFTLKDEREDAVIDCVMYRSANMRAHRRLAEGAGVILLGRVTVYAPRGRLQFIADDVLQTARGALLEQLEQLKARLHSEGLFDPARKRPLPGDPRCVAVLTSRDGAAIHDFVRVAARRGPVRVLLVNTPVQGAGAARRIAQVIRRVDRLPGVDAIVVTRGGGSLEDLAAYNDEQVARAIVSCHLPVVSAVGHEVDVTVSDLVADARAATPSQAAELLVPDERQRRAALEHLRERLHRAHRHGMASRHAQLGRLRAALGEPRRLLMMQMQRFDELRSRLARAMQRRVARERLLLQGRHQRLHAVHPRRVLAAARLSLGRAEPRLRAAMLRRLAVAQRTLDRLSPRLVEAMQARRRSAREALGRSAARLDALSPLAVLGRGYAIATTPDGHVLVDAATAATGDEVYVRLHRGQLRTQVLAAKDDDERQ